MAHLKRGDAHGVICILAACALLYELVVATTLVLLFGDVIYYFSLTVAFFILFMGIGSGLSHRFAQQALLTFLVIEVLIALLGGSVSFALLLVASETRRGLPTLAVAGVYTAFIGIFTGMELPLLFQLTEGQGESQQRFGFLLIYDYLGSLIGSILFAFLLLPKLDVAGTSLVTAGLNLLAVAYVVVRVVLPMRAKIAWLGAMAACLAAFIVLAEDAAGFQRAVDQRLFAISEHTQIVRSFRTRYQKVVVALTPNDDAEPDDAEAFRDLIDYLEPEGGEYWVSIYLNGYLQALSPLQSPTDFYHHAFVHPAMLLAGRRASVLILGGGDGLPAKEVEKYSEVQRIVNVDIDGEWVDFVKNDPLMRAHSLDSLRHPKLTMVVADAFKWVRDSHDHFDVILVDFPEGIDLPLARSYSSQFLKDLKRLLNDDGVIAFQVDSFDNAAFWCVIKTMLDAGFFVIPHHSMDPDEAEGLILLSKQKRDLTDFDRKVAAYPFLNRRLMASVEAMEIYRDPRFLAEHIAGLEINTFYRPSFLTYYRATFPWKLSIGAD